VDWRGSQVTYFAANVLDGDPSTAWAEGRKGSGVGEWVDLEFQERIRVKELHIWNGYQKVLADKLGDRYYINERPKDVDIETDSGTRRARLDDSKVMQTLPVGGDETRHVRVYIRSVYEAKYLDCAISEIGVIHLAP